MNWWVDCLVRIKNAGAVENKTALVRGTKFSLAVLRLLKDEGFILDYKMRDDSFVKIKQACEVFLSYYRDRPLIQEVHFVSTSKNRVHKKAFEIIPYVRNFRFCVVSTNEGLMSGKDAIDRNLGGELLFWLGVCDG